MYTPKIQNSDNTKGWQGYGATGTLILWYNKKWHCHRGRQLAVQQFIKFNSLTIQQSLGICK